MRRARSRILLAARPSAAPLRKLSVATMVTSCVIGAGAGCGAAEGKDTVMTMNFRNVHREDETRAAGRLATSLLSRAVAHVVLDHAERAAGWRLEL